MGVVVREVIDHARLPRVHVAAAERLGVDDLAGGGLHQRRTAEEDGALLAHDDRLVAHGRHVGAARGARTHHHRELRDAARRHLRLVVEDPSEVLAIGEHVVLARQERAARIDQVDARQPVLERDVLRAQVLLDRDRVVGAALHRGVVADDHALDAAHAADAGDHAAGRDPVAVQLVAGELPDLEERRARVEQAIDPVAHEHLAARLVLLARRHRAARRDLRRQLAQFACQAAVDLGIGSIVRAGAIDAGLDEAHGRILRLSRARARRGCVRPGAGAACRACRPRRRRRQRPARPRTPRSLARRARLPLRSG